MAYVAKQRGFEGFNQRVYYAVKKYLASKKQPEFFWRQMGRSVDAAPGAAATDTFTLDALLQLRHSTQLRSQSTSLLPI